MKPCPRCGKTPLVIPLTPDREAILGICSPSRGIGEQGVLDWLVAHQVPTSYTYRV